MEQGMNQQYFFSEKLYREDGKTPAVHAADGVLSYEEFHVRISRMCSFLRSNGITEGTRVGIWGYNSASWLIAFFAVIRAGGTAVLLNYSQSCEEVKQLLSMSCTQVLLYGENGVTKREKVSSKELASRLGIHPDHCIDLREESRFALASDKAEEKPSGRSDEETSIIIFTSGTTSAPKAVQLSQRALSFSADAFNANTAEKSGNKVCIGVPLFHILGLLMSYACLCRGGTLYLPLNYKPDTLLEEISKNGVTDMVAVGAVYTGLSESDGFESCGAGSVKLCMIAGGMSTPVQMMRLELKFSNAVFINMYGLSEAAPLTMVSPDDLVEKRATTVGKPIPGMDVRISDGKGTFLSDGGIGEVVARGPNLMNGYYNLPQEKQAVDTEGWLHTGDLGWFDDDGFLHLSGRIKDIIIRGGENISPSEIENALLKAENVKEAKVMGAPHPIYGESVEACITLKQGEESFDENELKALLKGEIAVYKLPSHIFLYGSFPLNVNGKLDQRTLRADLLMKLRLLSLDDELAGGVTVFDLVVKNKAYAIVPVTGLVSELAADLGFSSRRALSIRLAVEEMLTERIMDAYSGVGNIRVRITLMPEWLRISFSDDGTEYFIDKRFDTSVSAKIILKAVSDFHTDYQDGRPLYCMDFLYEDEVSIRDFMMKGEEI